MAQESRRDACLVVEVAALSCDETKPQCANCLVVERTCEYAAIRRRQPSQAQQQRDAARRSAVSDTLHADTPCLENAPTTTARDAAAAGLAPTPAHTTASSRAASPGRGLASDPDAPVNVHHMRLLLHFSLATAVPELPAHLAAEGTALVLREALETPYLLHQVLALSARHLAHLHPSEFSFYYGQAIKFQTRAIEGFSAAAAESVTGGGGMPAVLFSALLTRHSLVDTLRVLQGDGGPGGFGAFLDAFVQCAQLQQGTRAVVTGVSWASLLASELAPFMRWGAGRGHGQDAKTRGGECDQLLRLIAITPGLDPVERESCRAAAHHLQLGFDDLASPTPDRNCYQILYSWKIYLPEEFVELLARHRPEAAAIMAWYAALLHHGRHMWQIGDAGAFVLASAAEFLGDEWSHWLEWPRSVIGS
ncbi:Zn(2)-C6 fungal-type DNA-binding domain protein [Cordyceps fumosorosea ARSEF 2679]|uniref:Zn(2)-C6 fungal-type DNA-binding domain protein n=1 Tax=Cordyceps fumosorosea (strain ARSEF 2679) TaxID=1081104 RepID=A0A167LBH9_CORFA|nr:Zn(2)-C6 fungal-type DNA-binding domain protein [Cordyceps fumosorosea ARSEF 2679]OAA52889.1 Zn(2)-C6 fungal-type DNA-binding domain protein [Cordyceps fumosorosea ARSEF 2679]